MGSSVRKVKLLKLPNGKSPFWYLRWWELAPDGTTWTEKWQSTKTTVRKTAEQKRRNLERELDDGRYADSEMTWAEFVTAFLEKHASRKPLSTQSAYKHCLNAFTQFGKPKLLRNVTHALLEDFATNRLNLGTAPATVNRDLRHVRAAMRWAKRRGLIPEAPDFKGVFVRENRNRPVIMPEEDFLVLVKALGSPAIGLSKRPPAWWKVFLYLAYYLGLRRGEALGLTWDCVSIETLEIRILAPTSKGRKERVVPIAPEIGNMLGDWKRSSGPARDRDEVLPWPYDGYRPFYDDWHAIQKAAGIPDGQHYVPKNCRSTCASALIAANVPTVVVKDFLGHATVATTENYYINTKPALRAAAAARPVRIEQPDDAAKE